MIEVRGLCKAFGEKQVLQDVNLTLPERGVVCFFGPSGSGKTTLLHILTGLLEPDAGEICGLAHKRFSYVFQEDRLLPWATALENAALAADEARARHWLTQLELGDALTSYPAELSGGMQRRVALARALAAGGDVFMLDEPFKGLDGALRDAVAGKLCEALEGRLTLMVSHDEQDAMLMRAVQCIDKIS